MVIFSTDGFLIMIEIDPSIIERQAVLDTGPLFGQLVLIDVTEKLLVVLSRAREDDQ